MCVCLFYRKCVKCHISHGLTQKEAGDCNHTCALLANYMDDASGTVRRFCLELLLHIVIKISLELGPFSGSSCSQGSCDGKMPIAH